MKNLITQGKGLLSRIWPHILVIAIVAALFHTIVFNDHDEVYEEAQKKYDQYQQQQDSMVTAYEQKLDSMQTANFVLEQQLLNVDSKIDSIEGEQEKINKAYEKEIDDLNNASVSDHDEWFSTKLDSLRQYYSRK